MSINRDPSVSWNGAPITEPPLFPSLPSIFHFSLFPGIPNQHRAGLGFLQSSHFPPSPGQGLSLVSGGHKSHSPGIQPPLCPRDPEKEAKLRVQLPPTSSAEKMLRSDKTFWILPQKWDVWSREVSCPPGLSRQHHGVGFSPHPELTTTFFLFLFFLMLEMQHPGKSWVFQDFQDHPSGKTLCGQAHILEFFLKS